MIYTILIQRQTSTVANAMRVGRRGGAKRFAALIIAARSRTVKQAQGLLARVEQAMEAETPPARTTSA
jgi:hypothetical protein